MSQLIWQSTVVHVGTDAMVEEEVGVFGFEAGEAFEKEAYPGVDFSIALNRRAGPDLLAAIRIERRLPDYLACYAHAFAHRAAIFLGGHEIAQDGRVGIRVGRGQ